MLSNFFYLPLQKYNFRLFIDEIDEYGRDKRVIDEDSNVEVVAVVIVVETKIGVFVVFEEVVVALIVMK